MTTHIASRRHVAAALIAFTIAVMIIPLFTRVARATAENLRCAAGAYTQTCVDR